MLLHLAAFGTPEQLSACLACPERFAEDRESITLGVSDQVPVWVKIGQEKQLYSDYEVAQTKKDGRRGLVLDATNQEIQGQWTDGNDGLTQLRSNHIATGDRYVSQWSFASL